MNKYQNSNLNSVKPRHCQGIDIMLQAMQIELSFCHTSEACEVFELGVPEIHFEINYQQWPGLISHPHILIPSCKPYIYVCVFSSSKLRQNSQDTDKVLWMWWPNIDDKDQCIYNASSLAKSHSAISSLPWAHKRKTDSPWFSKLSLTVRHTAAHRLARLKAAAQCRQPRCAVMSGHPEYQLKYIHRTWS